MNAQVEVRGERMIPMRATPACIRYVFELGHEAYAARDWQAAVWWFSEVCRLGDKMGIPQPETCEVFVNQAAAAMEAGDHPKAAARALVAATNAMEQLGIRQRDE